MLLKIAGHNPVLVISRVGDKLRWHNFMRPSIWTQAISIMSTFALSSCMIALRSVLSHSAENTLPERSGQRRLALLGRQGGAARALADISVVVPHEDSGRIQEAHIFIGHTWCGQIERGLGLVK